MSAEVLLEWQAEDAVIDRLRRALSVDEGDRIDDLHVEPIGQDQHAAEVTIVSDQEHSPTDYKMMIPENLGIVHVTVEVHHCSALATAA